MRALVAAVLLFALPAAAQNWFGPGIVPFGGGSGGGGLGGTGTDNYLVRWDGTTAAQDSAVYVDDTGRMVVTTAEPAGTLTTDAAFYFSAANVALNEEVFVIADDFNGAYFLCWQGASNANCRFDAYIAGDLYPEGDSLYNLGGSGVSWASVWTDVLDGPSNRIDVGAALVPSTPSAYSLGASAEEWATLWVNTLDDSDGTVTVAATLRVSGTVYSGGFYDDSGGSFLWAYDGDLELDPTRGNLSVGEVQLRDVVRLDEVAAGDVPALPATGKGYLWSNSATSLLYWRDDAGADYDLTASGLDETAANAIYLRLDATNAPLTGTLSWSGVGTEISQAQPFTIDLDVQDFTLDLGGLGTSWVNGNHRPTTNRTQTSGLPSSYEWAEVGTVKVRTQYSPTSGPSLVLSGNATNASSYSVVAGSYDPSFYGEKFFAVGNNLNATPVYHAVFGETEISMNEEGKNMDFRVESDTSTHAVFVDASANAVGLLSSTPTAGSIEAGGDIVADADGTRSLGASATEFLALWTNTIKDSDALVEFEDTAVLIDMSAASGSRFRINNSTGSCRVEWTLSNACGRGSHFYVSNSNATTWFEITNTGDIRLHANDYIYLEATTLITTTQDIVPTTADTLDLGASDTEFLTVWTNVIDDNDGEVDVDAALDVNGSYVTVGTGTSAATVGSSGAYDLQLRTNGTDRIVIDGAGGDVTVSVPLRIQNVVGTTPAAPATCDSTLAGAMIYVDDTDDSSPASFCVCMAASDDGAGTPSSFNWVAPHNGASCF